MAKFTLTFEDVTEENIGNLRDRFPEAIVGGCIPDWEYDLTEEEKAAQAVGIFTPATTLASYTLSFLERLHIQAALIERTNVSIN